MEPDAPTPDEWQPVVALPDPRQARELLDLLAAAGVPARLQVLDRIGRRARVDADFEPSTFTVVVPAAEVPVAIGVAERFLPWFVPEREGGLTDAECAEALDEPHEEDFAERLESERLRAARFRRSSALAIALLVATVVVTAIAMVVRVLR